MAKKTTIKQGGGKAGLGSVSYKIRKALKCKKGEVALKNADLVKKIKKKLLLNMPAELPTGLEQNVLTVAQATAEHLAGETQEVVEKKYKLGRNTVQQALRMYFPSQEQREQALENILLDNAVHAGMVTKEKMHTLSARDAALVTGIMTQRYTELKKARSNNHQQEIPVNLVLKLENTIERVKQVHGRTLD